jgi:hypothetical protein
MLPPIGPTVRAARQIGGMIRESREEKPSRNLTEGEVRLASSIYGSLINYSTVKIFNARWQPFMPDDRPHAPDGNIYFGSKAGYGTDFSRGTLNQRSTLVHEMGHVWQVQRGENVILKVPLQHGSNNMAYKYGYIFGEPWKAFERNGYQTQMPGGLMHVFFLLKLESQAEFMSDYYRIRQGRQAEMAANAGHPRSEYGRLMPPQLRATAMGPTLTS